VSDDGTAVNVTVPCESSPPFTLVGFTVTDARLTPDAAVTLNVALFVTPPNDAEIVAVWFVVTLIVPTENVAAVAPAATVTLAGTVATLLALERVTTAPPDAAAPVRVTVPVDGFPPTTVAGLKLTALSVVGATLVKVVRTAIQSRKKSLDVELDTSITRTRKFALARSAALHVRPHVSVALPSINVV